jgi:putative hydrolase of the HAD superfamily
MKAKVDTLIFDLDDTLVVEEPSARAAIIETGELARIRYGLDPTGFHATLREACRKLWYGFSSHPYCKKIGISSWEGLWAEFTGDDPDLKALKKWAPTYRLESWRTALTSHGIDDTDLAAELAETFPRIRRGKHVIYEDTSQTLAALSQKHSLGLLTNGAPDLQRRKIDGAGIKKYFDQVLISGDIGIGKPDRRIFDAILMRLNVSPETSLMIGNSLISDVKGAQSVGMRAVWLNRSGKIRDDSIIPDWEISSLNQLSSVLDVAST